MEIVLTMGTEDETSSLPASAVRSAEWTWRSIGVAFFVAAATYATVLFFHGTVQSTYRIGGDWSAFAGLFVLALAIERALEPFTRFLGPDTAELEHLRNKAVAANAHDAVEKDADLKHGRQLTAIVVWGAATALGFALSSALNITLLQALRADGSGRPPFWADLLVTGLVIGAGTKPLHDLVANLQKNKDNKADGTT
jgi:hypothetical protein